MTARGFIACALCPTKTGRWQYTTHSNVGELDGKTGQFDVVAPSKNNHGPVRVRNTFHFAYADGTPYKPTRHDVLRLDVAEQGARRANAENAGGFAIQQASDVRLSEVVYVEQE